MKRLWWVLGAIIGCWMSTVVYAACPTRDNTYEDGEKIQPAEVMANEDALFEGIQDGLETACIADNAITTAKIAVGAVTSSDILDGTITTTDLAFAINPGNTLPAGAVFFMVTGTCPSWTTDVSATYANLFVRINSTQGTLAGADTHTHTAGSYIGPSHTHSVPYSGWTGVNTSGAEGQIVGWTISTLAAFTADNTTGSGGGGASTGTSGSSSGVPSHVSMRACQVQ